MKRSTRAAEMTDLERAEAALAFQAELLANINDAVVATDKQYKLTYWNRAAEIMYGWKAEEVLGKDSYETLRTGSSESLRTTTAEALKEGTPLLSEFQHRRKDGSEIWVEATAIPIFDSAGEIAGFASVNRDITERKRMEQALGESEKRYRELVKYAPVGIYEIDFQTRKFLTSNDAMVLLTGYSRDELMSMDVLEILDDKSRRAFLARLGELRQGQIPEADVEYNVLTKDGRLLDVVLSVRFKFDEQGRTTGAMVVGHDVTERKRAEEELRAAKQQAELYLDLMGHDISNLHQIAMGQLELAREILAEKGGLKAEDRDLIDVPLQTLDRSARLIENVRKLQKSKAGEFEEEIVELGGLLSGIVKEYEFMIPPGSIAIAGEGPALVKADKLLHDVFANMVRNAIIHSGGRNVKIRVRLEPAAANATAFHRVSIEDNGPGIPDERKLKIFERLRSGQARARGLGLALVKALVESYRGRIWVEDRVKGDSGKGSRFVVLLPAMPDAQSAP